MHGIEYDSRGLQCLNCTNACSPIMKPNAITMTWVNRLSKDSFATSVVVIVWGLESTCFWTPRLPLLPITSVYLCHHHLRCGHHPHYLAIQQHLSKDAKEDGSAFYDGIQKQRFLQYIHFIFFQKPTSTYIAEKFIASESGMKLNYEEFIVNWIYKEPTRLTITQRYSAAEDASKMALQPYVRTFTIQSMLGLKQLKRLKQIK